jgi:hypothetical protein
MFASVISAIIGAWLPILVIVVLVALFVFAPRTPKDYTTPISAKHSGKKDTHRFKFDPEEVRLRPISAPPVIDLSNLPDPDKRVATVLKNLVLNDIENSLRELSGEKDVTVRGARVTIKSRNSYSPGLDDAMTYLEEFYKQIGVATQRIEYKWRGRKFYNLEATVTGSVNPEKVLVVGSHLDSTAGNTWGQERVAPGADDDASGTVACMELAKALLALQAAGATIGCTVRILHFTCEEQGLWGSYTYSDKVANEGTNVIGMIQMDMIGYCAKKGNRVDLHDDRNRNGSHKLIEVMVRNIARYKLDLNGVDTHDRAIHDRSDHAGFADHGFMAVCISEEFTEGENGGFNPNYHSENDRIDALNLPYMQEVVKLLIASVADLAEVK